jgi:valyl-tRNA synthetase
LYPHSLECLRILSELNNLIEECREGYGEMNAFIPANAIRTSTWNVFADHYIEAAKSRAYNRGGRFDVKLQRGTWYTLHKCLETILKILAPICPFITEAIWLELYSDESIHIQSFPQKEKERESELSKLLPKFIAFNNAVWRYKKEKKVALSQSLPTTLYAPEELRPFEQDARAMHRIEHLQFGEPEEKKGMRELAEGIFVPE